MTSESTDPSGERPSRPITIIWKAHLRKYPPSFYMQLKDPHAHWEMIQALENGSGLKKCSFNIIFGKSEGYRIYASRKVAEKIENYSQTDVGAQSPWGETDKEILEFLHTFGPHEQDTDLDEV